MTCWCEKQLKNFENISHIVGNISKSINISFISRLLILDRWWKLILDEHRFPIFDYNLGLQYWTKLGFVVNICRTLAFLFGISHNKKNKQTNKQKQKTFKKRYLTENNCIKRNKCSEMYKLEMDNPFTSKNFNKEPYNM